MGQRKNTIGGVEGHLPRAKNAKPTHPLLSKCKNWSKGGVSSTDRSLSIFFLSFFCKMHNEKIDTFFLHLSLDDENILNEGDKDKSKRFCYQIQEQLFYNLILYNNMSLHFFHEDDIYHKPLSILDKDNKFASFHEEKEIQIKQSHIQVEMNTIIMSRFIFWYFK